MTDLNQLNRKFYNSLSQDWNNSRQHPWLGWQEVMKSLHTSPASILDIGCGNGRFLQFLQKELEKFSYTGLDFSEKLLEFAAKTETGKNSVQFKQIDLINQEDLRSVLQNNKYDLITVFAVMHHLPTFADCKMLLQLLAEHLNADGVLVYSLWEANLLEKFSQKIVREISDTEFILNFKGEGERYVKIFTAEERLELVYSSKLNLVKSFAADSKTGNLNTYYMLKLGIWHTQQLQPKQ